MLLKKMILTGSAILLYSLSNVGLCGGLVTLNYTDEDSTVKITSGKFKPCAGSNDIMNVYTPKRNPDNTPGRTDVDWGIVKGLCISSGNTCTANIYMSQTCDSPVVGVASLDVKSLKVMSIYAIDSRYVFTAESPTQISLKLIPTAPA